MSLFHSSDDIRRIVQPRCNALPLRQNLSFQCSFLSVTVYLGMSLIQDLRQVLPSLEVVPDQEEVPEVVQDLVPLHLIFCEYLVLDLDQVHTHLPPPLCTYPLPHAIVDRPTSLH